MDRTKPASQPCKVASCSPPSSALRAGFTGGFGHACPWLGAGTARLRRRANLREVVRRRWAGLSNHNDRKSCITEASAAARHCARQAADNSRQAAPQCGRGRSFADRLANQRTTSAIRPAHLCVVPMPNELLAPSPNGPLHRKARLASSIAPGDDCEKTRGQPRRSEAQEEAGSR
jgi:hypothetical protein